MSIHDSIRRVTVSRPAIALMILCGVAGATAAGAATVSDTSRQDDVLRIVVRYDADSLATDGGARKLYRRLVNAAEQACPAQFTGSRLLSHAVQLCREQSVARAVQQIDNVHLAAVHATTVKRG